MMMSESVTDAALSRSSKACWQPLPVLTAFTHQHNTVRIFQTVASVRYTAKHFQTNGPQSTHAIPEAT
jgi:hypothetical protein